MEKIIYSIMICVLFFIFIKNMFKILKYLIIIFLIVLAYKYFSAIILG